jgi:hypothetical protein
MGARVAPFQRARPRRTGNGDDAASVRARAGGGSAESLPAPSSPLPAHLIEALDEPQPLAHHPGVQLERLHCEQRTDREEKGKCGVRDGEEGVGC